MSQSAGGWDWKKSKGKVTNQSVNRLKSSCDGKNSYFVLITNS